MKCAADFRQIARSALSGKWAIAVIAGLIAVLLGGAGSNGPEINLNIENSGANISFDIADQTIFSTGGGFNSGIGAFLMGRAIYIILGALVLAAIYFVLGSIINVGYSKFNLELVDHREVSIPLLFQYFPYWKTTSIARLLRTVYVFLWSLLLVIPGILASYSYAMTDYILAEHPELTANEAISISKEIMYGNRWRLFCLQFSFIGWSILASLTMGIGNLWLTPYKQAATAAFYREISGPVQDNSEWAQF